MDKVISHATSEIFETINEFQLENTPDKIHL